MILTDFTSVVLLHQAKKKLWWDLRKRTSRHVTRSQCDLPIILAIARKQVKSQTLVTSTLRDSLAFCVAETWLSANEKILLPHSIRYGSIRIFEAPIDCYLALSIVRMGCRQTSQGKEVTKLQEKCGCISDLKLSSSIFTDNYSSLKSIIRSKSQVCTLCLGHTVHFANLKFQYSTFKFTCSSNDMIADF